MRAEENPTIRLRLPYLTPWALKLGKWSNPHCLWRVPTKEKIVALTFDDGPSRTSMPALLATLRKHKLKATFFVLGNRIGDPSDSERFELLVEAARDGHEIAVHGETHRSLFGVPDKKILGNLAAMRRRRPLFPVPPAPSFVLLSGTSTSESQKQSPKRASPR